MLLKIDVKPEDIIQNKNGRIIIKINYFSAFGIAAHLCTVDGETIEEFQENKVKKSSVLFVGSSGGISLERQ